jgi:hypothetical protein
MVKPNWPLLPLLLGAHAMALACGTASSASNPNAVDAGVDATPAGGDTGADSAANGGGSDAGLTVMQESAAPDSGSEGGIPESGLEASSPPTISAEGGGVCCPYSTSCSCLQSGGWAPSAADCSPEAGPGFACAADGCWTIGKDDHGCSIIVIGGTSGGHCCGAPPSGLCGLSFTWRIHDAGTTQASCQAAMDTSCCAQERACAGDPACLTTVDCINPCPRPASQCVSSCVAGVSAAAKQELNALGSCSKDGGVACDWP